MRTLKRYTSLTVFCFGALFTSSTLAYTSPFNGDFCMQKSNGHVLEMVFGQYSPYYFVMDHSCGMFSCPTETFRGDTAYKVIQPSPENKNLRLIGENDMSAVYEKKEYDMLTVSSPASLAGTYWRCGN